MTLCTEGAWRGDMGIEGGTHSSSVVKRTSPCEGGTDHGKLSSTWPECHAVPSRGNFEAWGNSRHGVGAGVRSQRKAHIEEDCICID